MMIEENMQGSLGLCDDERLDTVNEQIRLIQKKQGLTFGTDAFLLAAYIGSAPRATVADLGSGTGILPLLLAAKNKAKLIHAVEIQSAFADLIARNARLNGLEEKIIPHLCDVRDLTPAELGGEVDLVCSNPPYMRTDSGKRNEYDEKYIARHEVRGGIADFCRAAGRILRYGGKFVTVWRPDRMTDLIYALRDAGMEAKRMTFVYADTASEPCMVLTEAQKGAAPSMRVSPPLILYEAREKDSTSRKLTVSAQKIYDSCDFGMYKI